MQRIEDLLHGMLRRQTTPPNAVSANGAKSRQNPAVEAGITLPARRLSLAEAEQIQTSAARGTAPVARVPIAGVPMTPTGKRRTPPVGDGLSTFPVATGGPPKARRDADNAVHITAEQAEKFLPPGRYRVLEKDGTMSTREVGESWCAEGLRLVRTRKGTEAAMKRREIEKMRQDDLFGEIR